MKKLIISIIFIFLLSLVSVNAQIERQPLIANTFFFNASTTSSSTFVTIGEDLFNITRETPISFVRASFQGTKLSGTAALNPFFWRILLDGEQLVNATQSLELEETAPIELQAGITDLSIGEHNLTFQHRVDTLSLRTSDISFSLLTNQFLNSSSIPLENQSISFTVDDLEVFTKFAELNFTKLRNDSEIFLSIFGQVTSVDSNVDQEIKLRMNGEESGVLSTGIESPEELKFVTYSWFFKNALQGNNTIEVFSRNLQNTKVTSFDGTIAIAETIGDDIEINFNETRIGTFITSSTTPVLVASILINVGNGSTLVIISETTATKSTSGKDNITMFVNISDFGPSFNHIVQLEGSSDIANFPFIAVPPATPAIVGLKNISLFAFVESTTVTLTNTSFIAIEILPIEVLAIVDNPPVVTLINPPDNNITNETTITFEVDIIDDFLVVNATLFHNASGLFIENVSQIIITTNTTAFFNVTFPTNITIEWNVQATDNASQTAFAPANFILTINQTFPPDTEPPVITLIFPPNGTVNNTIPLNITFTVTDDSPNDIICTLTNTTTTFDSGTFTQGINNNLTLAEGEISLSQNFPNLELTCFDNTQLNNSALLFLNYTLDTIPPIIFLINPPDEERFNRDIITNINIKANCTDVPVFRFNITIDNTSNRIASFESRTPVNNFIVIDEQLNIETLGLGNYTITYTCADPHTTKIIQNYNIKKNDSEYGIKYTTSNNQIIIRYLNDSLGIIDYGTSKTLEGDKYKFWYNTGETETKSKHTYTFEILTKKPITYLINSNFNAHFVSGNNWIDFEFGDADAVYIVTLNENNNYEIEITTTKTNLQFGSIGDLNVISTTTTFEIFFVKQIKDFFSVTVCNTETGATFLMIMFFTIAFVLIIIGIMANIGFIGFFGSILLMILSWFLFACIAIFAFILILLSLVLMIFFVIRSLGFENKPFN